MAVCSHPIENILLSLTGRLKVTMRSISTGSLGQPCKERRFTHCQIPGMLCKICLGSRLHSIGAITEIDLVEINMENIILAEQGVNAPGQYGLFELTKIRLFRSKEQRLGNLLGNGGSPLSPAPTLQIVYGSTKN